MTACNVLLSTSMVLSFSAMCLAQHDATKHLLIRATFDYSLDADIAKGNWQAFPRRDVALADPAKSGKGLHLPMGSEVCYTAGDGNINPSAGTVSFWICPEWDGTESEGRHIFMCRNKEANEYMNINVIPTNRLGIAMRGGGKDWVWRRIDTDVTGWKAGDWHHLAFAWDDGKLRFYVDGKECEEKVDDAKPMTKLPDVFTLSGCDAVIDDLQIYGRMLTSDEIARMAASGPAPLPFLPLSCLTPSEAKQSIGEPGLDCLKRVDGMHMPMMMHNVIQGRGVGVIAPASVKFKLPDGYKRLIGKVGFDDFAHDGAVAEFSILADGEKVFSTGTMNKGSQPRDFSIPVENVSEIELRADSSSPTLAGWVDTWLVTDPELQPPTMARQPLDEEIDMYRRRRYAYHFTFPLPQTDQPYLLARKNYLDEIDVTTPPDTPGKHFTLRTFATPGEYEPLCFVIYAARDLEDVTITISPWKSDKGELLAANVDVRTVKRGLYRTLYTKPPWNSEVVSRFLEDRFPFDMEGGTLREIHMIIHVPEDARADTYRAAVTVSAANAPSRQIPVELEVLPFKLRPLKKKIYGMYYSLTSNMETPEKLALELKDMREHGATILYPSGLTIRYEKVDDRIEPNFEIIREGLALMKRFGYSGPIPVNTGFNHLARLAGHSTDLSPEHGSGESLNTDEKFQEAAARAMVGLLRLQQEFPEFEILPTHMDEVLGRDRLGLYINLTRAVRQAKDLRVYITLHNIPRPAVEEMTKELDPYVDVRCYNGHAMDWWLQAGHTFDELAEQLKASGDEAWIYYNIRGSFFLAKWMRIVNGLYMWLGPFKAHCPWKYHSYHGDPFDDTDGPHFKGHDFAYAVPDPRDGKTPVPTRHWEAYREGVDDMRYINTLEELIAERRDAAPEAAAEAQKWLDSIRAAIPYDEMANIEEESPLLIAISRKWSGDDLQDLRRTAADHIMKLLKTK